jgi:lysine 6-dehydrogenase
VSHRYGVLGSGRQGTAAAYDLVVRGDASSVVLGDVDEDRAGEAASTVNRLARSERARGVRLRADDAIDLRSFLEPIDAAVSALPYPLDLEVARTAVEAGTHVCDLGGNTSIVLDELKLDDAARAAGVSVVPDCGEAPGLANNLVAHAVALLDEARDVLLLDGGLPLDPMPPWNYELTFHVDGLTNEYDGVATSVVDGSPTEVRCFDPAEYELLEFEPPFGLLEAFVANTASTLPWTVGARVRSFKAKVLRYPGHAARYRDLGLFERDPVEVSGREVVPRDVYHALLEPRIRARPDVRDVVIARVMANGQKDGRAAQARVDFRVYPDPELGFTSMERATGWHAATVCHLMASGRIAPGATPVELAVPPELMMKELARRGFHLETSIRLSATALAGGEG